MVSYTTVQKVLVRFEVLMAVHVESFKLHAFDPIVFNMTRSLFHGIFKKHCSCFEVFQLHHSIFKKLTIKFFKARNNEIGIFKRHKASFSKRLEVVFYKTEDKSYSKIATIEANQRVQLLLCAKSSSNQEL